MPQNLWLTGLADGRTDNVMPLPGASMQVDYVRYYARVDNQTNWVGNKSLIHQRRRYLRLDCCGRCFGNQGRRRGSFSDGLEHPSTVPIAPYQAITRFIANGTRLSAWVIVRGPNRG